MDRNAEVLRDLRIGMRALLKPVKGREPPLFELSTREVRGKPSRHSPLLPVLSHAEINKATQLAFEIEPANGLIRSRGRKKLSFLRLNSQGCQNRSVEL